MSRYVVEREETFFFIFLSLSLTLTLPSPIVSFLTKKILFTGPTSTQVCYRQPTQRERTIGGFLKSWVLFFFFFFFRVIVMTSNTHTHTNTQTLLSRGSLSSSIVSTLFPEVYIIIIIII